MEILDLFFEKGRFGYEQSSVERGEVAIGVRSRAVAVLPELARSRSHSKSIKKILENSNE
jgi:hypothetical protein